MTPTNTNIVNSTCTAPRSLVGDKSHGKGHYSDVESCVMMALVNKTKNVRGREILAPVTAAVYRPRECRQGGPRSVLQQASKLDNATPLDTRASEP